MNAFIASLYIGYALYAIFPYTAAVLSLGKSPDIKFALSLLIYVIAVAITQFIVRRFVSANYGRSALPMVVLGVLAAGMIVALLYHVFGITAVFRLPGVVNSVFAPNAFFFYWFAAPLVGLFFFAR